MDMRILLPLQVDCAVAIEKENIPLMSRMKVKIFFVIVVFPDFIPEKNETGRISQICFDFFVEFNMLILFLVRNDSCFFERNKGEAIDDLRQSPKHVRFETVFG